MASLEQINRGDRANDGTGDPVRTAFGKINNNANTLNAIGIGNTLLAFTGNAITSSSGIDLSRNGGNLALGPVSNLQITGGTNFQFLQATGNTGGVFWGNGVAGNPTQIQYNKGNQFAGTANFTYNDTSNTFSVDTISAQNGTFSNSVSITNGLSVDGTTILQDLQVNGTATIVNTTQTQTGNLTLELGYNIGNASSQQPNSQVNGGGIILGNNITGGNVNMRYSSMSDSWVFSRPIVSGSFNSASFASGTISSITGDFNILNANIGAIGLLDSNFINIDNPSAADGLANSPTGGTVLNLENTAETGQGWVGIRIGSNRTSATSSAPQAGSWSIYTEGVTGNLSFVGSYASSNAAVSASGIKFGKDGKIYASGIYDSATGNAISGGNPAGSNYQLQYNFNNQFSASSGLTYNPSNGYLTVTNINVLGSVLQNDTPIAIGVAGYDTTVQYNSNGMSAGSNSFRFLSSSNVVAVAGNIVANSVYSVGATSITSALGGNNISAIAYSGGYFVAGSADGSFAYSTNGVTWANTGNSTGQNIAIRNLTYFNNTWVSAQTANLSSPTQIWTSPLPAAAWTRIANVATSMLVSDLETVTLNNQTIVLGVGNNSTNGTILYGSDLTSLSTITLSIGTTSALYGVDSNGTTAVAVGIIGTGARSNALIITAATPNIWTPTTANLNLLYGNNQTLFDVAWGTDRFVAVGDNPNVTLYSTDGSSWASARSNTNTIFSKIAFSDGLFIAVGNSGNIWTTRDGLGWQQLLSGNSQSLSDIAVSDSRFVAVGSSGTAVTAALTYSYGGYYAGDNAALTGNVSANTFVASGTGNLLVSSPTNIVLQTGTGANVVASGNVTANAYTVNGSGNLSIVSAANIVLQTGTGANVVASGNITTIANVYANNLVSVGTNNLTIASAANIVLQTGTGANVIASGNARIVGILSVSRLSLSSSNVRLGQNAGVTNTGGAYGVFSVAVGTNAGQTNQGNSAVAVGPSAGSNTQGQQAVAIGSSAGINTQGLRGIAIGQTAGSQRQGTQSVAIGAFAGQDAQGANSIAIGSSAALFTQRDNAIAIGQSVATYSQGANSIAIGTLAAGAPSNALAQGQQAIAIGANAGYSTQGISAVAVGANAGSRIQGATSIAIGLNAGSYQQNINAVAIGTNAGQGNSVGGVGQGINAVAIGYLAGQLNQTNNSVAIGPGAGQTNQGGGGGFSSVAVGSRAGGQNQNQESVAVGTGAGEFNQNYQAVAVGTSAGSNNQSTGAIAIGHEAGRGAGGGQNLDAVAVGFNAGQIRQGRGAVAIGGYAGQGTYIDGVPQLGQGTSAVAIGYYAGQYDQPARSIMINATGNVLPNAANRTDAFYVAPIRSANATSTVLYYNTSNNEITYGNISGGGGSASVAGPNLSVQFNLSNSLAGYSTFTYNPYATIGNIANVGLASVNTLVAQSMSVGNINPSGIVGELRTSDNIIAYYRSDAKFKANVITINNALEKTRSIRGVEFDWTEDYLTARGPVDDYFNRRHDVGVIAQELANVLPEVVATKEDGTLAVKYDRIPALLIQAIKELDQQVQELKEEIKKLKGD